MPTQLEFLESFNVEGLMGNYRFGKPETAQMITSSAIPNFPADNDGFFTPARLNAPFEDKSTIAGSKMLWVDRDIVTRPVFIIPPTWVVQSGTGQHVYFELTEFVDATVVEELNKILIRLCDGDPALSACTTILRVPGTINTKYTPPKRVTITSYSTRKYLPNFIRKLGKLTDKTLHKIFTGDSRGFASRSERDWNVISELATAEFNYDEILLLYTHNRIGDKLNEDGGDAYFKRTYKNITDKISKSAGVVGNKANQAGFHVDTENSCYKFGNAQLSTFVLDLLSVIILPDDETLLRLRLTTKKSATEVTMPKRAFNSVKDFDNFNKNLDAHWLGSDGRLRQLLAVLTNAEYAKIRGVRNTGLHRTDDGRWIHLFDTTESTDDMLLLPKTYGVTVVPDSVADEETVKANIRLILELNRPETMWTMLSWYVGALAKPYLETEKYRYPILQITGTTGAGKTTTVHTLLRLFSIDPITYDANTTEFVMLNLFGSSNAIPIPISEHRSASNLKDFIQLVLLSYDSGHNARGRIDRSVADYPLTAPICVDGEDTFADAAAVQRSVVALFKNNHRNHDALQRIATTPLGSLRVIANVVRGWIESGELIRRVRAETDAITVQGISSDRPAKNHAILAAVASLLAEYIEVELPSKFWMESVDVVMPNGRPKLLVDDFITDVIDSIPTDQAKFIFAVYSETQLVFQMSTAYNWWVARQRARGGTVLDLEAVRRQLMEKPYYERMLRYKASVCYMVDIAAAAAYGLEVPSKFEVKSVL